ncbi:MAG TPA: ribbon-helix-helix protein, CopG family [Propionicimonas sp.]|nr:ribbon-helix-helix protein, CopG family [Propionicimonas sp.]HQD98000.1 ribbon-helix-helix protein, CopG family [Propionicimonas sp.]
MSSSGRHSPMLNLRVSEDTKAQLEHLAEASGRRQSDLVRDALAEYLERHAS